MLNRPLLLRSVLLPALALAPYPAAAQDMPAEYQQALSTLGRPGDFKDNVLKVNIPRNDVSVTVAGVATPTPFGFGGWVAMTRGDGGHQVLMGDLVLLQDEVNPVMSTLLDSGLEVTALHNHFFWDEPRMFYMHVHGHGGAAELAAKPEAGARPDRQAGRSRRAAGRRSHCVSGDVEHDQARRDRRRAGRADRRRLQVHAAARRSQGR
jgi:hypothetical protein